jgi:hypothetical protein
VRVVDLDVQVQALGTRHRCADAAIGACQGLESGALGVLEQAGALERRQRAIGVFVAVPAHCSGLVESCAPI